jgi:2-oxoisovalerate dehydrogenase E1 component alpha subunit
MPVMPAYRVMDEDGSIRPGAPEPAFDRDAVLRMYTTMVRLQTMDNVFYDAQRQGRISFYMTNWGEEATHIGSAMAWQPDDEVFAQYREAGVLMWRGFSLQNFADQVRALR